MSFNKPSHHFPFSSDRYETTYGMSYNRNYNFISKPGFIKSSQNNFLNTLENKPMFESNPNIQIVKDINNLNTNSNIQVMNQPNKFPIKENNYSPIQVTEDIVKQYDYNHMMTQIAKITNNLFLSGLHAISNDRLQNLGITLVVSLIAENSVMRLPASIQRLQVNIEDTENVNIRRHFESVLERMNLEERRNGRILVHCVAGISRSSTIVIAYLMRYHNLRLRQAYDLVHSQRPYIQPNLGFWKQLIDYEKSIFGTSTVNMIPMDSSRVLVPDVTPSILSEILSTSPMIRTRQRCPISIYPVRSNYSSF